MVYKLIFFVKHNLLSLMNTPFKVRKNEEIGPELPELSLEEINVLKEELEVEDDPSGIRGTGAYI